MSNSPGDYFHQRCKAKGIYTVLRVDAFYYPTIFDNNTHKFRDLRTLDKKKILINQRLQMDLLMSNWVVYQSHFSKDIADSFLYNRVNNFSIIPNGVNEKVFIPSDAKNKKPVLLMFATFRDKDVFRCCLKAFLILKNQIECRLRIIGPFTDSIESELISWIEENNLDTTEVEILGKLSFQDLPKAIATCDIMLFLKAGDSCPNGILESMSCGLPVVCNDWGGSKELVGNAGIVIKGSKCLYDDKLSSEAAAAVLSILEKKEYFSSTARERVEKYFSVDSMVNNYMKIFLNSENIQ